MKINIKHIITAMGIVGCSMAVSAQNTQSGYFVEDYTYRFQMNPAFANSKAFFAMPALGNINVGLNGNTGIRDFLYSKNGKVVTFLNPQVSYEEMLSNLADDNRLNFDSRITLLAFGFNAFSGYNTITLGTRASAHATLPIELFTLLKQGVTNTTYNISNIRAQANVFADLSFSHSHQINSELSIGAAFKILFGAGHADMHMRNAQLMLGENEWTVTSDAEMNVNMKGFRYETKINESTNHRYVNDFDVDNPGLGGVGVAFDLGAVYSPASLPEWEFSMALLDLGAIAWSNNSVASTQGLKTFSTDKYTFNVDDDAPNSFDNEWDKIKNDFSALYELDDLGDQGGKTCGIGATLNIGVLYTLPTYKKLKFGLLNTTRLQGDFTWTDFRLSANLMASKVFDGCINASVGSFGVGFGWLANLHCTGFNLFLGMDRTFGKAAKQGIPLGPNVQFNMGINFPI